MELKEFTELKKPERYDMKAEYADGRLSLIPDPIARFIVYKAPDQYDSIYERGKAFSEKARRKYPDLYGWSCFDCDRCGLMTVIYKALWADVIGNKDRSRISGERGDTMTSFQTALNLAIRQADEARPFGLRRAGAYSQSYCTALYCGERDFCERMGKIPGLRDFAARVHTIGNFLPVPAGFNCARAGVQKKGDLSLWHDYWDLTLMKIKEWYDAEGDSRDAVLWELLHGSKDDMESSRQWLAYFGTWERFTEENYMQDFVDGGGTPILFCAGHDWEYPIPGDLATFFWTAAELIEKRGKRMATALRSGPEA